MPITDYDATAGNNTSIDGTNIAEGCAPGGLNNAIRSVMADLKAWSSGRVIGTDIASQADMDAAEADIATNTAAIADLEGTFALVATATGFTTQAEAIHTFTAQNALDYGDYQLRLNNVAVNVSAGAAPGTIWTEAIGVNLSGLSSAGAWLGSYVRARTTTVAGFDAASAGGLVVGECYGSTQSNGVSGVVDIFNLHEAGVVTQMVWRSVNGEGAAISGGGVRASAAAETSISLTSSITVLAGGSVELWGRGKQ